MFYNNFNFDYLDEEDNIIKVIIFNNGKDKYRL